MQNNVTDLSQKLQRSLDNNYNVIDMPTVIEIISTLEKTAVTKELLETTQLARYINELRRRTSNESLAKRGKKLLKKWRDSLLPDANGQIKSNAATAAVSVASVKSNSNERSNTNSPDTGQPPPLERSSRKRPAHSTPDHPHSAKRIVLNGQSRELDFSDNSNCSVKELKKTDVIFINSDSNSSMPDQNVDSVCSSHSNDTLDVVDASSLLPATNAQPKKRGRKKGSKNHKNLVIAAEESFSNKMAVSRNSKVKTTQELLADLQNRTVSASKTAVSQELRAAQLTESLSRIDQKLNPQKQINKNVMPIRNERISAVNSVVSKSTPNRTLVENWSLRSSPEIVLVHSDDEIVDVVGTDPPLSETPTILSLKQERHEEESAPGAAITTEPLTIDSLLSQLPPVDPSCLDEADEVPICKCPLPPVVEVTVPQVQDRITVQIVNSSENSIFASSPLSSFTAKEEPSSPVHSSDGEADAKPPIPTATVLLPLPPPPMPTSAKEEEEGDDNNDDDEDEARSAVGEWDEASAVCPAKSYLRAKYNLDGVTDATVDELHARFLPNVNGNWGVRCEGNGVVVTRTPAMCDDGLYVDIVPNLTTERLNKELAASGYARAASENFQKYSISIGECRDRGGSVSAGADDGGCDGTMLQCDNRTAEEQKDKSIMSICAGAVADSDSCHSEFREWHETLDVPSYNGETLRVLPYVIID